MPLETLLQRLHELLTLHSPAHAAWLQHAIALPPEARYAALNSAQMWGGAGSLAATALHDNPGLAPEAWALHSQAFRDLLIELGEQLKARERHYPDIDYWLSVLWQQNAL